MLSFDNPATAQSFEIYRDYLSMKMHFKQPKFDYTRSRVKVKFETFERRKDVYYFHKLSRKSYAHDWILANLIQEPDRWIGKIVSPEGNDIYLRWKKIQDSMTHTFKSDLKKLDDCDLESEFRVIDGEHPNVLRLYWGHEITLETLVILAETCGVMKYWKREISDTIIAPKTLQLIEKYTVFLEIDKQKYAQVIKDYCA